MSSTRKLRSKLRAWVPPALEPLARQLVGNIRFEGDYLSWADAAGKCEGYSADVILQRVRQAASAVRRGEAAFERDSVVFEQPEYVWHLLAALLWIAGQRDSRLHVLDFGGSLGSLYYQHRPLLQRLKSLRWSIVEQPGFVECGQREFQDDTLRFYPDIEHCLEESRPDVLLLSGVLQYLEKPYEFLEQAAKHGFDFMIIDRMPLIAGPRDRLCLQHVSERIYPATYPAWFLSRARFLETIARGYRVVVETKAMDRSNISAEYCGLLLEKV